MNTNNTKKKKYYFDKKVEDAIIKYNEETDPIIKNKIYKNDINYAFEKLAENIIHTFKFYYFDVSSNEVKHEVVSYLILNIHKYNKDKGKAFSYFSIIAKNYLILHNNKNYKRYKMHDKIDVLEYEKPIKKNTELFNFNTNYFESIATENPSAIIYEFIEQLILYWEMNLTNVFKRKKDIIVADSILSLFKNRQHIENFNKKYLYVLVREQTGSNTPHITRIVNIMKSINKRLHYEFNNKGHVNMYSTGSLTSFIINENRVL